MKLTTEQLKKIIKEELESIMTEKASKVTDEERTAIGRVENALKAMGASPLDMSHIPRPVNPTNKATSELTVVKLKGRAVANVYPSGKIQVINYPQLKDQLAKG